MEWDFYPGQVKSDHEYRIFSESCQVDAQKDNSPEFYIVSKG